MTVNQNVLMANISTANIPLKHGLNPHTLQWVADRSQTPLWQGTLYRAPQPPLGGGQLSSHTVSVQVSAAYRGDEHNYRRASITAPAQEPCSIMAFT